jgi:hypothetical protein
MRKIPIIFLLIVLTSCSTTNKIVDYDLFKNELNAAIQEGFPESTYQVK